MSISILKEKFELNHLILEEIKNIDSIYYGNQISQVTVLVKASLANYFKRRDLLPNRSIIKTENVSEQEILALVHYWVPNLTIVEPEFLQEKLDGSLMNYRGSF